MSYKAAWDAVNEMNNLSESPIVKRESGGKGGGGTVLTQTGHDTINLYKKLEMIQQHFWSSIESIGNNVELLEDFSKRMMLRTSARNQLLGTVAEIETTKLGAIIDVSFSGGETVKVFITRYSFEKMNISINKKLFVILKSSWITLSKKSISNNSNNLPCTINRVLKDDKDAEVEVSISGGNTLTVTLDLAQYNNLDLKENDKAWISFKPSNAILAI